jgi:hypothetical protein
LIGITAGGVRQQVARGALAHTQVGGRRLIPIAEVRRILSIAESTAVTDTAA